MLPMKKKAFSLLLLPILAIVTAGVLGGLHYAQADYGSDFTVNQGGLLKYNGADANVTLPAGITSIGREAFANNPLIESVVIPNTVTAIEYGAFANCNGLQEVVVSNSVTKIDDSAFSGCTQLNQVSIGSGLEKLGNGVFSGCDSLKNITFNNNTNFCCADYALYNADQTTLYQYFAGSQNTQYDMPDSVTDIGRYAFWGCRNLEDVMVSSGLKTIPEYAFSNCNGLETVFIDTPVNSIAMKAFENCTQLMQVTIPISVGNIHENAFDGCSPDLLLICENDSTAQAYANEHNYESSNVARYQVEYIEEAAQSVVANESEDANTTENREDNANESADSNEATNPVDENNGELLGNGTIVSDRVFISLDHMNVQSGADLITNETPQTVILEMISDYAFYRDSTLNSFDFEAQEEAVQAIGEFAFARSSLTSITIPDSVVTISYGAFYHCDSLEDVVIPDSVTHIEAYAFEHTPWLDSWRDQMTNGNSNEDFLIVGDGILLAYKGTSSDVVIPDSVKTIADGVFRDHTEISSVIIPTSVHYIGSYAFAGCAHLVDVLGDLSNVTMEQNAFDHRIP